MPPLKIIHQDEGPAKRGLCATSHYSTGDIICSFEPAVNIPLTGRLLARPGVEGTVEVEQEAVLDPTTGVCAYCLNTYAAHLQTECNGCQLVSYCSVRCLEADDLHEPECNDICAPQRLVMSGFLRALFRILCLAEQPRPFATYAQLTHHTDDPTWPALDTLRVAAESLVSRGASRGHSLEQIIEYAGMLFINQYTRCDDLGRQAGYVFDPTLALVNHSCVPNAYLIFRGRRVHLVCWKPISEGEEVTLSYSRFMHPTPERRTLLYMHFRFWCECPGCKSPELHYPYSHVVCTQCGIGVNRDPFSLLNPPTMDSCLRNLLDGVTEAISYNDTVELLPPTRLLVCECENNVSVDVIQAILCLMTYSLEFYDSSNFKQLLGMVLAHLCLLTGIERQNKCLAIVNEVTEDRLATLQLCLRLMAQSQVIPQDSHLMTFLVTLRNLHQLKDEEAGISDYDRMPHIKWTIALALMETLLELRYCRVQQSSYNPVVSISLFMMGNYIRILASDASKVPDFFSDDDLQSVVNITHAFYMAANENLMFTHPNSRHVEEAMFCADLVRKEHDDLIVEGNLVVSRYGLDHDLSVICGFLFEYLAHDGLLGDGSFPQTIHILDVGEEMETLKGKLELWYQPV